MNKLLFILFIVSITATTTNYVYGQAPPVVQLRPEIQTIFQELTSTYPTLTQNQVNVAHEKLTLDCINHGDPNNFFMGYVCSVSTGGMLKGYLEALNYEFVELGIEGKTPQLLNSIK